MVVRSDLAGVQRLQAALLMNWDIIPQALTDPACCDSSILGERRPTEDQLDAASKRANDSRVFAVARRSQERSGALSCQNLSWLHADIGERPQIESTFLQTPDAGPDRELPHRPPDLGRTEPRDHDLREGPGEPQGPPAARAAPGRDHAAVHRDVDGRGGEEAVSELPGAHARSARLAPPVGPLEPLERHEKSGQGRIHGVLPGTRREAAGRTALSPDCEIVAARLH